MHTPISQVRPNDHLEGLAAHFKNYDYPKQIVFETTAHCNLYCSMCSQPTMLRPKGLMDFKLYQKIIDEVATFPVPDLEVWYAVHGEPLLLGNRLIPYIQYAKERGIPNTCLNTNGMLLTEKNIDNILTGGIDIVILGLDGHSQESFVQARVGGDHEVVKNNTLNLLKEIKKRGLKTRVQAQLILMPFNVHEKEAYKEFWLSQGAEVKIREQITWAGACESPLTNDHDIQRIPCPWVINNIQILWDGRVPICSSDTECDVMAGNLNSETVQAVWQKQHRQYRDIHLNRDWQRLPEICKPCKDWVVGQSEKHQPTTESA